MIEILGKAKVTFDETTDGQNWKHKLAYDFGDKYKVLQVNQKVHVGDIFEYEGQIYKIVMQRASSFYSNFADKERMRGLRDVLLLPHGTKTN